MKRFHFTLQTLLEVKKRREDECKRLLAVVNAKLMHEGEVLRHIETEWVSLQSEEFSRRKKGSTPESMGRAVQYRLHLEQKAHEQGLVIQRVLAEQEARRKVLVKATQEKKALENIREHRHQEWKKDYNREQTARLDDLCQIQFVRREKKADRQ